MSSGFLTSATSECCSSQHVRPRRAPTLSRKDKAVTAHAVRQTTSTLQDAGLECAEHAHVAQRAVSTLVGAFASGHGAARSVYSFIKGRHTTADSEVDLKVNDGGLAGSSPAERGIASARSAGLASPEVTVRPAHRTCPSRPRVPNPDQLLVGACTTISEETYARMFAQQWPQYLLS
jgi:hypothetical protein